ncbi:MAG: endonuclease/exonuclease/phosphatase family protein [Puniceicoccaceae bacterium]
MRFPFLLVFLATSTLLPHSGGARGFSVLVFNVENVFDIDGEALFSDYRMPPEGEYSPALLLKKLEFTADTLAAIDDGRGPDIVLFQELERDRTPAGLRANSRSWPRSLLKRYSDVTVEEMLTEPIDRDVRDLPSVAFLLKALSDRGMEYPYVAIPAEEEITDDMTAHINATFSRFPIFSVEAYETQEAREILVAEVEIGRDSLFVINNHWKSGASRPETEVDRVENARTVRGILDRILDKDPRADVLVGGDLNSYYDQILLFPEMERTGINSILGSQGDEAAVARGERDLYNLWFELPIGERYTETWRDMKGTLMHILVTPGLYDDRGVRYVDNSFERIVLPGLNVDEWGRPLRFRFAGEGRGGSDHLPVLARFEKVDGDGSEIRIPEDPGRNSDQPGRIMLVDYDRARGGPEPRTAGEVLAKDPSEWGEFVGDLFHVSGKWAAWMPPSVATGETVLEFYSPRPTVWARIGDRAIGDEVEFLAELQVWGGEYQWVVRDPTWLRPGDSPASGGRPQAAETQESDAAD